MFKHVSEYAEAKTYMKVDKDAFIDWPRTENGQPFYFMGDRVGDFVEVVDRRVGPFTRRDPRGKRQHPGRRFADKSEQQRIGRTVRQDSKAGLEMTLKVDVGPELKATTILGRVDSVLDRHFGPFRRFGIEHLPELVQLVVDKADERGKEIQAQQRRMTKVREALNLPIGDPVEAIKGLQKENADLKEMVQDSGRRLQDCPYGLAGDRWWDIVARLGDELQQTKDRMERERKRYLRERGEMKALLMGRPTGLGPKTFAQAFDNAKFFTTCPWKFRQEIDTKRATGRTTRMLTAALDAMIDGGKVLVCGAGSDWKRLMQQAEEMLRKRVQHYTTNNTKRELSCPPFPGRVRFCVLPPPAQVDRVERDLERGDIFVDHYAVERIFSILSETDGRSVAMLRLAYPRLAAQLDR